MKLKHHCHSFFLLRIFRAVEMGWAQWTSPNNPKKCVDWAEKIGVKNKISLIKPNSIWPDPNGLACFWAELADGLNTFFIFFNN